jgi:hypothetical protein
MPFDTKVARKRGMCIRHFVVESDPDDQYAEPTQTVHYPDNETAWSGLVLRETRGTGTFWRNYDAKTSQSLEGYFMSLIRHLKEHHYDVVECAFLPHSQLRVGTINAIAATIEADRFAVYRCIDESVAAKVAAEVTHAIQAGSWVFRSIPVLMYADPHYEMGQLPEEEISWSPLLENEDFKETLKKFTESH